MILYKTILKEAEVSMEVEKSNFIGYIKPVENREEADEFIKFIKKKNKDATHNVPAMVIGPKMQIQWASDDGEPQGTSGPPIVQMLVSQGITNVAVVVTRYFGGIKLGTGGLVRAYTGCAKLALESAGIAKVENMTIFDVELEYGDYNKIISGSMENFSIQNTEFLDKVKLTINCMPENLDLVREYITNITKGNSKIYQESMEARKIEI